MFKLTIEDDEGKTTVVPLIRDEMTIGRDEGNTIRLTDRNVSRRHARLTRQNAAVYVEDLKSFTGVRVNGTKIAALTSVGEGDQVQIGDYKIRLKSDRPAEPLDRATRPTMSVVNGESTAAYAVPSPVAPAPSALAAAQAMPMPPSTSVTSMGRAVTPRPVMSPRSVVDLLPTPDPIEAQPTIPLRMLSEMDPAMGNGAQTGPQPVTPARLVVLTTELAGKEYILDRASLVIGRTNENDVVLNHRSISRHHAKIVQDRDRISIVDLQSANGVRVNGEDYERIELHAGDVVELGHVRLRFVGPAEHFVFDPASRVTRSRFSSRVVLGLTGIALVGAVAVIVVRMTLPRDEVNLTAARAGTPNVPSTPAAVASAPAPAAAPPPAAHPAGVDELWAQANAQAKSESWDATLAALDRLNVLLGTAPPAGDALADLRRQAADLHRHADSERRSAIAFAKFEESAAQKNNAAAIDWYGEIPDDSAYKKRAAGRYDETRTAFVAAHLQAAEKLRAAGRCTDLRQEVELIQKVDPQNSAAEDKLRLCRARPEATVASAPTPIRAAAAPRAAAAATVAIAHAAEAAPLRRAPPASVAPAVPLGRPAGAPTSAKTAPAAKKSAEGGATAGEDADALLKQARDAWLRQQCGSAIDLSRRAIRAQPDMVDAYQVIAVCSCSLKDAEGATRAYAKLDDKGRNLVRTLCQRNGISVGAE